MTYTLLSLFSGGMGLDLGLARTSRFRLLGCVERDATWARRPSTLRVGGFRDAGETAPRP